MTNEEILATRELATRSLLLQTTYPPCSHSQNPVFSSFKSCPANSPRKVDSKSCSTKPIGHRSRPAWREATKETWDSVHEAFVRELDFSRITLRLNDEADPEDGEDIFAGIQLQTKEVLEQCLVSVS